MRYGIMLTALIILAALLLVSPGSRVQAGGSTHPAIENNFAVITRLMGARDQVATTKQELKAAKGEERQAEERLKQAQARRQKASDEAQKAAKHLAKVENSIIELVSVSQVYFAKGDKELDDIDHLVLDYVASLIKALPKVKVRVLGHTDDFYPKDVAQKLSEERAQKVMSYMVAKGIDGGRIASEGKGKDAPQVRNRSNLDRAKNRRVEFAVSK